MTHWSQYEEPLMSPEIVNQASLPAILERLDRMEAALVTLVQRQTIKDWYSTAELAQLLNKAEFTVREWCRHGRMNAGKKGSGRGAYPSWVISSEELQRFQREGLLPSRSEKGR
jgi:hypothetical protein